jgi:hypothetical protein
MSSLIHKLDKGVVIYCHNCKSPMKDFYFTHLCDYRKFMGSVIKQYCISCLQEKGTCKICKQKYIMKTSYSL